MAIKGRRGWQVVVLLLLTVVALLAMPVTVRADRLDDETRAIAKELRCPVCAGETVADSNAQLSVQMRGIIRQKLEAGESREAIMNYFVARYGVQVLAAPPARGFTLGVWLAPIFALLVGLAIVVGVLRGWLRGTTLERAGNVSRALLPADDERLEREVARFRRETARE